MKGKQNPTHMALCEKVFAPHPLLKHNCGLSHLSSVSLATPRPDSATPVRNQEIT